MKNILIALNRARLCRIGNTLRSISGIKKNLHGRCWSSMLNYFKIWSNQLKISKADRDRQLNNFSNTSKCKRWLSIIGLDSFEALFSLEWGLCKVLSFEENHLQRDQVAQMHKSGHLGKIARIMPGFLWFCPDFCDFARIFVIKCTFRALLSCLPNGKITLWTCPK